MKTCRHDLVRCAVASALFIGWLMLAASDACADPPVDLETLRSSYLREAFLLRDYRPGKNSFVEGPDRRWGAYTKPGQRLTLLDVQGTGRLCHIWSTWRPGQGRYRLEFYLDGASHPQIVGTLDELINAAQRMTSAPVPVPGFVGNREARNLFLPVPFQRDLRIEAETLEPTWLIFWQIEYRLGDKSGQGQRLEQVLVEGRNELRWHAGPLPVAPPASAPVKVVRRQTSIVAGGSGEILSLSGPAVVRRWQVHTNVPFSAHGQLSLRVYFDDAPTPAIRAPLADFFGPLQGVSLVSDEPSNLRTCYLPIPLAQRARFMLHNDSAQGVDVEAEANVEPVSGWQPDWGYFHALGRQTDRTTGYRQHEVLTVQGRGQWLGMALYNTGHDHGGGDFAVIDAENPDPAFLHGVNGEDYFTFAWFGRGEHHPFAIAGSNEAGRYRHHFENPYPFQRSLRVYWGTYPDLVTRSVAYWYQAAAEDTTVDDDPNSVVWDCFGPVPLQLDEQHRPVGDPYAVLPSVAALDSGQKFECRCVQERFASGWMQQRSFGPMLDLTYLARHGTKIRGEVELGGMGHAFLARRHVESAGSRRVEFQISHDDPLRVLCNGREVYRGDGSYGFSTRRFTAELQPGRNEFVVQLTNFFNVTFNWAGFALREVPRH